MTSMVLRSDTAPKRTRLRNEACAAAVWAVMIHDNISKLAGTSGVLSVAAAASDSPLGFAGDPIHHPLLTAALALLEHTSESRLRLVLGPVTVIIERHPGECVAIAVTTGHEVCKSLARTTRRMHERARSKGTRDSASAEPKNGASA